MPLGHTLREDGQTHRDAWEAILRRDTCSYCSQVGPCGTVDHVDPTSRGGSYRVSNLTGACESCNGSKADRVDLLVWMVARSGLRRQPHTKRQRWRPTEQERFIAQAKCTFPGSRECDQYGSFEVGAEVRGMEALDAFRAEHAA